MDLIQASLLALAVNGGGGTGPTIINICDLVDSSTTIQGISVGTKYHALLKRVQARSKYIVPYRATANNYIDYIYQERKPIEIWLAVYRNSDNALMCVMDGGTGGNYHAEYEYTRSVYYRSAQDTSVIVGTFINNEVLPSPDAGDEWSYTLAITSSGGGRIQLGGGTTSTSKVVSQLYKWDYDQGQRVPAAQAVKMAVNCSYGFTLPPSAGNYPPDVYTKLSERAYQAFIMDMFTDIYT